MTDNATFLRQSLNFMLAEQKKIDEIIKKTVTETKAKYQRWVSDTPTDENAFMDVKRDIDEVSLLLHNSAKHIEGNGVLEEIEARRRIESIDFNALIQRIQVVEKAMSGYQKDNDTVKSKLATIENKVDTAATTATAELQRLKASDVTLSQTLGSFKATTEKELKDHTMRLTYIDILKTFFQKQPERDAKQDAELEKLKEELSKLSQSLTEQDRKLDKKVAEVNGNLFILGNNDNQLQLKTQELDARAEDMLAGVHDILNQINVSNSRIEDNARVNRNLNTHVQELSAEVGAHSENITNLNEKNESLQEAQSELQRDMVNLKKIGHEERLQNTQRLYLEMEGKVSGLSKTMTDYINGRSAIGFTASPAGMSRVTVAQDQLIKFKSVAFNPGNNYNPTTGLFTAPASGLYFTSVTACTLNDGRINVAIKHRSFDPFSGCRKVLTVCRASATVEDVSSTSTGVVHLEAGDQLYVTPITVTGDAVLSCYSSFSCILLS